jgi:hypothetical protein
MKRKNFVKCKLKVFEKKEQQIPDENEQLIEKP